MVRRLTTQQHTLNTSTPLILAVDMGGRPLEWMGWQEAVRHYALEQIGWTVGDPSIIVRGGTNARGLRSEIALHPVVALHGADGGRYAEYTPPLSNRALFARDGYLCLYCGERYHPKVLTRDHVIPTSRGGANSWENCVSACKACNNRKDAMTPEEARMPLLALPYAPNHAEGLMLANRHILADQMAFLEARAPRRKVRG